ncbi:MAG: hypothetical protein JO323_01975 [Acidobacteriia bacterium]|nr:hypothetical protein [Terriglobia bacterium]
MRVIERYTLTGPDILVYQATMTDPKVFTKPWTIRVTLQRHKEPSFRITEDECLEDTNGVRHHLPPSRVNEFALPARNCGPLGL